jgi:hypothetical protein
VYRATYEDGSGRRTAHTLAKQRAGRQRPGESDEEYEARWREFLPRANPVPPSIAGNDVENRRKARDGVK